MKATFLSGCAVLLVAGGAVAGPETIIKQRAKELRDQNNVRQGVPPATAAPLSSPAPAATAAPAPQRQNMTRLQSELAAIKPNTPVTPEQKKRLSLAIQGLAEGSTRPSPGAAEKLADQLCAAIPANPLSAALRARLVQDLDGLINPQKYPQAKKDAIIGDIQAIFQSSGLTRSRAVAIAEATRAVSEPAPAGGGA